MQSGLPGACNHSQEDQVRSGTSKREYNPLTSPSAERYPTAQTLHVRWKCKSLLNWFRDRGPLCWAFRVFWRWNNPLSSLFGEECPTCRALESFWKSANSAGLAPLPVSARVGNPCTESSATLLPPDVARHMEGHRGAQKKTAGEKAICDPATANLTPGGRSRRWPRGARGEIITTAFTSRAP